MKSASARAALIISLVLPVASMRADELIADQRNEFSLGPLTRLVLVPPIIEPQIPAPQISFTPSLASVDFAQLQTQGPALLQVLVLRDTNVIGASELLSTTNSEAGTNLFRFHPGVALMPGSNYVLQVRSLDNLCTTFGNPEIWFREGIVNPAPIPPPISIQFSYVELCWNSEAGTNLYQVQYRSEETTNIWTDLGPLVLGDGITRCLAEPVTTSRRSYRVKSADDEDAGEAIVDQRNELEAGQLGLLFTVPPIHWSQMTPPQGAFTPTLTSLDFVELRTQGSATLQILILRDSKLVGVSDLLTTPNVYGKTTNRFVFSPSLSLAPGSNYALQVRSFDIACAAFGDSEGLWFREGKIDPAPASPPISIRYSRADLSWNSRTGTNYQVQFQSEAGTWENLTSPVRGNGLTNRLTELLAAPHRLYRLKVLP